MKREMPERGGRKTKMTGGERRIGRKGEGDRRRRELGDRKKGR